MSAFAIGRTLGGRYRIDGVLARGGMGAVYRALDERVGRAVAVKVLLAELATDTTELARFRREASIIASLQHPGIVQVLDVGAEEGVPYLVMEHIQGRTIADLLGKEGKVDPARAADIVEQALFAIAAAHAAGVVHRDLKPGNVMLVPTGGREMVKVLDFGIAQLKTGAAYTRLTQTGVIVGTPIYMAPEQAHGNPCDARTDVYAMGVVLWCMLTARRPFAGHDMAEILTKVLAEVPVRADRLEPTVPEALAKIAEVALAKAPQDRFPSASAFASALVDLRSQTVRTAAPTPDASFAPPTASATRPMTPVVPSTASWGAVATSAPATGPMTSPMTPIAPPGTAASIPNTAAPMPAAPMPAAPMPAAPMPAAPMPMALPPSALPPSALPAPVPPQQGWSTRTVLIGAGGLVAMFALVTCLLSAVACQQMALSAPAQPGTWQPPPPGDPDSVCERAVRCCEVVAGGNAGCANLRVYTEQGASGEANCAFMLDSYGQSARLQGRVCN